MVILESWGKNITWLRGPLVLHRGNNSSLGRSNPKDPGERRKTSILVQALGDVLKEIEDDTDLFQRLLGSYPTPLAEVKKQRS